MNGFYLLALINFVVGLGVAGIALCRLNAMQRGASWNRVLKYAAYMAAGMTTAGAPWLGTWPTYDSFTVAAAVFIALLCDKQMPVEKI